MTLDPRTPVFVGAGLVNVRDRDAEPIDVMARATEQALDDASSARLRRRIGAVRVVWGVWPYRDPGRLVAERIGVADARTTLTTLGGNQVYDLVADTASRIARGELDAAVVCGAETLRTRRHDRAAGGRTAYLPEAEQARPDEVLGSDAPLSTPAEEAIGVHHAVNFYAMAETAIRHRNGESVRQHRDRVAALWATASEVAGANPDAWTRRQFTAAEIAASSESNRPIAAPYPKLMTSNLDVDQGAAVVICSAAAAEQAGIPADRWVFPWSGANASDTYPTNRWAFDESPAMRLAAERALELAAVRVDDCELLDLYSCFPSAVQVAQRELGVTADRPFTITGGLTFAAGPLNCYCLLALVRSVRLLRETPHQRALLTGNGGYFTKHSMLVLGGRPSTGFRAESAQAAVDTLPTRPDPAGPASPTRVETYTVTFDRDQRPERAILACLGADGCRHWAESYDAELAAALLDDDLCGTTVEIDAAATAVRW